MSLDDDLRYISQVPLFAALEPAARRLLAMLGETRILSYGEVLFCRGEPSDGGYVLFAGSMALRQSEDGKKPDRRILPVVLIGELALISKTERPLTAIACESSVVMWISRTAFHRVLKEFPSSARRVRGLIAQSLRDFSGQLEVARVANFDPDASSG